MPISVDDGTVSARTGNKSILASIPDRIYVYCSPRFSYADTSDICTSKSLSDQRQFFTNIRYASSSINVTLPFTGEPGSLSYGRDVSIDTGIPYIVSVTSNLPNGTYTIGAVIEATVHFNYPVVVVVSGANTRSCNTSSDSDSGSSGVASCGGLPALKLDVSGMNGDKDAIFVKGNGSNELVFEYEVSACNVFLDGVPSPLARGHRSYLCGMRRR